jgi:hypothetical protein
MDSVQLSSWVQEKRNKIFLAFPKVEVESKITGHLGGWRKISKKAER